MKCREARQLFFLYLDSELDARSVQEVNLHLEACPDCRSRWSRETALEEAARRAAWAAAGPVEDFPWSGVEERIRSGAVPSNRIVRRIAIAAALALGALIVIAAAYRFLRPVGAPVEIAALSAVEHHDKYLAGKSPLQIRGSDPEAVRRFYAGELGFEVRVPGGSPAGGPAGEESPAIALEGARRCTFLGGPVAYVAYRIGGEPVTAIIGPLEPPPALLEAISSAPEGVVERAERGCRTILSSARGRLFLAAGDVPFDDLRRLLRDFREIQDRP